MVYICQNIYRGANPALGLIPCRFLPLNNFQKYLYLRCKIFMISTNVHVVCIHTWTILGANTTIKSTSSQMFRLNMISNVRFFS